MNVREQFKDLIDSTLGRLDVRLRTTTEELSAYAAQRSEKLALILERNEPGFDQAVIAERDNVALRAGLAVGETAGAVDREWLGLFAGALRFAAMALAG